MIKKSFVIILAGFCLMLIGCLLFKVSPLGAGCLAIVGALVVIVGPEL